MFRQALQSRLTAAASAALPSTSTVSATNVAGVLGRVRGFNGAQLLPRTGGTVSQRGFSTTTTAPTATASATTTTAPTSTTAASTAAADMTKSQPLVAAPPTSTPAATMNTAPTSFEPRVESSTTTFTTEELAQLMNPSTKVADPATATKLDQLSHLDAFPQFIRPMLKHKDATGTFRVSEYHSSPQGGTFSNECRGKYSPDHGLTLNQKHITHADPQLPYAPTARPTASNQEMMTMVNDMEREAEDMLAQSQRAFSNMWPMRDMWSMRDMLPMPASDFANEFRTPSTRGFGRMAKQAEQSMQRRAREWERQMDLERMMMRRRDPFEASVDNFFDNFERRLYHRYPFFGRDSFFWV